jgi:hypothetical protein
VCRCLRGVEVAAFLLPVPNSLDERVRVELLGVAVGLRDGRCELLREVTREFLGLSSRDPAARTPSTTSVVENTSASGSMSTADSSTFLT